MTRTANAEATPWPICQDCKGIPLPIFSTTAKSNGNDLQQHLLKPSFFNLCLSASRGCHVCTILYEAVTEPFKSSLNTAPVYIVSQTTSDAESIPTVGLAVNLRKIRREEHQIDGTLDSETTLARQLGSVQLTGDSSAHITLSNTNDPAAKSSTVQDLTLISSVKFTLDHHEIPSQAKNYKDLISLYKDDPGAATYIRQSLKQCLDNHRYKGCEMVQYPHSDGTTQHTGTVEIVFGKHGMTTAPTRLIDVGSDNDVNNPPCLVMGKNCLQDGEGYLVLSYCNGTTPKDASWRLTTANKEVFERALPLSLIPQTLHDAIVWTRWLGHRYIWIDNLCIIQDSPTDWQRESSRMASIYGSATMTLVPASGSIYGGMTGRRNPLKNCAAALSLGHSTADPDSKQIVFIIPAGQRGSKPLPAATESRAWCYQEDLLSPRLVRFSLATVEWQCCANTVTPERAKGVEQIDPEKPWRLYDIWYVMIERYTCKQLTYANDKLTAFSGIAANKAGSKYAAGLLKSDPWASLLWCRTSKLSAGNGIRYNEYIAPSWSWAGIDVAVEFPYARRRPNKPTLGFHEPPSPWDPILHDVNVGPTTLNTLGPVGSGQVDLTACVAMAITTTDISRFGQEISITTPTLGTKHLLSPGDNPVVLGELIFDVASECRDGVAVKCVLLHVSSVKEWSETGYPGLGIAVVDGDSTNAVSFGPPRGGVKTSASAFATQNSFKRIGYVKFAAAFASVFQRERIKII